MAHKYYRYSDMVMNEEIAKKLPNRLRYIAMAFRPAGTLLFCLGLTLITSVPCVFVMLNSQKSSSAYSAAMAILTGVVASGLVSISIELANNYRHNMKRFVVLIEYLYLVSMYEQFVEWGSHGNYETFDSQTEIRWTRENLPMTPRMRAVGEVILIFGSVIEDAVKSGREYLSVKELGKAMCAVDAADKLGETIGDIVQRHLATDGDLYECLDEPLKSKVKEFSKDVGVYFENPNLESVVCDFCLSNPEQLGTLSDDDEINDMDLSSRNMIIHCLSQFDRAMHKLQNTVKMEPVIYENLRPFEEIIEKYERKLYGKNYEMVKESRRKMNHF